MVASSSVVKQTAKAALKPRLLQSVVACCVLIFAFYTTQLIGSVVSIFADVIGFFISVILLCLFIILPLALGVLNYFKRLIWGQEDSILIIFKYFSSKEQYKRCLRLTLTLGIKLLIASLVLFLPAIVIEIISSENLYTWLGIAQPVWTSNLWTLNSFVVLLAFFALFFVMIKYYLSAFIFVSNDDIEVAEAVNMSTIISKRTGGDFFGLVLSFLPWILLSLLVAPLIFTLPYMLASYSVHSRFAITAYNMDVDRFSANNAPSFSTDEIL